MACKDVAPKIVAILNIVVGFLVAASAVLWVIHFLDHTGYIEYLLLAVAMFILGLILIFVEVGYKRDKIYKQLFLLANYAGRGFYTLLWGLAYLNCLLIVFSISFMIWHKDRWFLSLIAWISAILQWVLYLVLFNLVIILI